MELTYDKRHISNVFFGNFILIGLLLLAYIIRPVLPALALTVVFSYFLHPIVERVEPHVRHRGPAIIITAFFILVPFFVFFVLVTSTVVSQIIELSKTPQVETLLELYASNYQVYLVPPPRDVLSQLDAAAISTYREIFTQGFGAVIKFVSALGGIFLQMLLGMFFTVYVLFNERRLVDFVHSFEDEKVQRFILFVDEGIQQVVYSMFFTALVTGIIATIIYAIFDIPVFVLLGVTTGVVALIPILGAWLVYLPITIYLVSFGDTFSAALFFFMCLILISTIPDIAIRPLLASKKVNTALLVLGFMCGALVFGAVGVLIGPLIIISWVGFVKVILTDDEEGFSEE